MAGASSSEYEGLTEGKARASVAKAAPLQTKPCLRRAVSQRGLTSFGEETALTVDLTLLDPHRVARSVPVRKDSPLIEQAETHPWGNSASRSAMLAS